MGRGKKKRAQAQENQPAPAAQSSVADSGKLSRSQPPVGWWQPGLEYYREWPWMLLPLLLTLACGLYVLHHASRPWVPVDAIICGRTVITYVDEDENTSHTYYPAVLSYVYSRDGREFLSSFEDEKVAQSRRPTRSFAEAVIEARRWAVGDPYPIYVNASMPAISRPDIPPVKLCLVGVLACLGILLYLASQGRGGSEAGTGCLAALLVTPVLVMVLAEVNPRAAIEMSPELSYRPYLEMVKVYPALDYVPQNQLKGFANLEELLEKWGRPDILQVQDVDGGRRLSLTYHHLEDWSQAWSVSFAIPQGEADSARSLLEIGPPREDHPVR